MRDYKPRIPADRWAEIGPFVRDIASTAAPQTAYTAHRLLITTSHYVAWCRVSGLPLNAKLLFQPRVIEKYIQDNERGGQAPGTLRNYRSQLLRISEILFPENHASFRPLNARTSIPPYSQAELSQLRNWADGQPTAAMRLKAQAMLCLCAGAGLRAIEVSQVTVGDVIIDDQGVLLAIHDDAQTRYVPMLAEWEPLTRHVVEGSEPDHFVFGAPDRVHHKNLLSTFVAKTVGADRPRSDRLRATWIVTHLRARTDMRALMEAAGVSKFQNLARYLQYVPELDTKEYREHLRKAVRA